MTKKEMLLVTCPEGHRLRASEKAIGKTLACPVCRSAVVVQEATPPAMERDALSDTGVMRILGDYAMPSDQAEPVTETQVVEGRQHVERECPQCGCGISQGVSICQSCRCYVGPVPDFFASFKDAS